MIKKENFLLPLLDIFLCNSSLPAPIKQIEAQWLKVNSSVGLLQTSPISNFLSITGPKGPIPKRIKYTHKTSANQDFNMAFFIQDIRKRNRDPTRRRMPYILSVIAITLLQAFHIITIYCSRTRESPPINLRAVRFIEDSYYKLPKLSAPCMLRPRQSSCSTSL